MPTPILWGGCRPLRRPRRCPASGRRDPAPGPERSASAPLAPARSPTISSCSATGSLLLCGPGEPPLATGGGHREQASPPTPWTNPPRTVSESSPAAQSCCDQTATGSRRHGSRPGTRPAVSCHLASRRQIPPHRRSSPSPVDLDRPVILGRSMRASAADRRSSRRSDDGQMIFKRLAATGET
jgi:hypothetical protein